MKKYWLFTLYFSCLITSTIAQDLSRLDSLQKLLKAEKIPAQKVILYNQIAREYVLNRDSTEAMRYISLAVDLAKQGNNQLGELDAYYYQGHILLEKGHTTQANTLFGQILKRSEVIRHKLGQAKAYEGLGILQWYEGKHKKAQGFLNKAIELGGLEIKGNAYHYLGLIDLDEGKYPASLEHFNKALEFILKVNHPYLVCRSYNDIGWVYQTLQQYSQALQYYFKALRIRVTINDQQGIANSYEYLGTSYQLQEKYEKALGYYFKALAIEEKMGNPRVLAANYHNIGMIYQHQKKYEKSLIYHKKSLKLYQGVQWKSGIAFGHKSIGAVYLRMKQYAQAKEHLLQALKMHRELNETANIGRVYHNLGQMYDWQGNDQKGLEYFKKSQKIAQKLQDIELQQLNAQAFVEVYQQLGNYKAALKNQLLYQKLYEKNHNEATTKKIAHLEAQYDFDQARDSLNFIQAKEKAVLKTKIDKEKLEKRLYRNVVWMIAVGCIFLLVFLVMLFVSRHRQQRLNALLTEQKNYLKQQSMELMALNKEVKQSNSEISSAHEEIKSINDILQQTLETAEQQRDDIIESINYAQRIQKAMLPNANKMEQLLPEYFLLYQPKNIVSGDFYWLREIDGKLFVVVADCTGHGVPGAFMTTIGLLSIIDIINQKKVEDPANILLYLDGYIRATLAGSDDGINDGMDAVVCVIDKESKEMKFAGAKNSIIVIQNNETRQIKGDLQSINDYRGQGEKINYTQHVIDLSLPTTLYLYSDGFQDQFGGYEGKKFMKKEFRELLANNHTQPMSQQKKLLEQTLSQWMKGESQVDDILVMGIQL